MVQTDFILIAGLLVLASLALTLMAGRIRMPALVVFIGVGMVIGSDGLGWIRFGDFELAQELGVIALALILFEGGLSSGFSTIRPVLVPSLTLATLGTLLTAFITGAVATLLLDMSLLEGLLLGSIIASTDAAAVFSVLRGSTLKRKLAATLEGEAGFNDVVAVILVISFITLIENPGGSFWEVVALFVKGFAFGGLFGLVVGKAGLWLMEKARFPSAGLYPVASLAIAAIAFGSAQAVEGSGFLAIYLAGLILAAPSDPALRTIESFHSGLAWIAQVGMFLMLGLLVFPSQLPGIAFEGIAIGLAVALLARPVATWVSTIGLGFAPGDRLTLGWAGLRGAVPIVLATFPIVEGVENGFDFFNIIFFAVVFSALIQGMTISPVAKWFGSTTDESAIPTPLIQESSIRRLHAETIEFKVRPGDMIVGQRVQDLHIIKDGLLTLVLRDDRAILPRGDTEIHEGDLLELIVRQEGAVELRKQLAQWRSTRNRK
ncbi:MAG: potassium/proton antiporter [Solirubrobacterales bacterium]